MINHIKRYLRQRLSGKKIQIPMTHNEARNRFEDYMRNILGHFFIVVDPGPVGDEELIKRTAVLKNEDVKDVTNSETYFRTGYLQMLEWLQLLEKYNFNLRTTGAVFELGCGTARLIRHLRCIDGIRLVGSDVSSEMIDWCKENVPGVEFFQNDLVPPLPFAEEGSFDLVFANSVFTHIPLNLQKPWIEELHRVLRPGGILVCNVIGRVLQEKMLEDQDMETLRKQGHLTIDADSPKASVSTQLIGSWDVFQTRSEVLKAFGSCFNVHDYLPKPLDLLVLEKSKILSDTKEAL
jgi:SAM-dependent methyltransferase